MPTLSQNKQAFLAAALVLLAVALTYLLRPISDPDFFWHLKTGEWIWQHGQLPDHDPFTFTGPQQPDAIQLFFLRGYALTQLLYHGVFTAGGWFGIYALRFCLCAAFALVFLARFALVRGERRRQIGMEAGLLLLFFALVLERFPLDRPQLFSFLFLGLLLLLIDLAENPSSHRPWLAFGIPAALLMAIWAHMHGGFLLGLAISGLYWLMQVFRQRFAVRDARVGAASGLFFGGLLGALIKLKEVGLDNVLTLSEMSAGRKYLFNIEYQNLLQYYRQYGDEMMLGYAAFIGVVLVLAASSVWRDRNFFELAALAILGGYALLHVRNIPFFLVASLPYLYGKLASLTLSKKFSGIVVTLLLVAGLFGVTSEWSNAGALYKDGAVSTKMPSGAADFLLKMNRQGRVFNSFEWGGYLLWRLSPQWQVYQDGRVLNAQAFNDWLSCQVNMKGSSGRQLWQEIFAKYAVDMAVLPKFSKRNPEQPHELAYQLSLDSDWRVLYHDDLAIVFAHRSVSTTPIRASTN